MSALGDALPGAPGTRPRILQRAPDLEDDYRSGQLRPMPREISRTSVAVREAFLVVEYRGDGSAVGVGLLSCAQ